MGDYNNRSNGDYNNRSNDDYNHRSNNDFINNKCTFNYVEFVLIKGGAAAAPHRINIDIGKTIFLELLDFFKKLPQKKMFSRNIIRYFYKDLVYEVCNKEVKTFAKNPVNVVQTQGTLKLYFNKHKIHYCDFPSTKDIYDIHNVSSVIFRFHNNLYINFEVITYPTEKDKQTFKVYLNYNHDMATDQDHIKKIMMDLQTQIGSTGFHLANFLL
jgi:hypothetical protein